MVTSKSIAAKFVGIHEAKGTEHVLAVASWMKFDVTQSAPPDNVNCAVLLVVRCQTDPPVFVLVIPPLTVKLLLTVTLAPKVTFVDPDKTDKFVKPDPFPMAFVNPLMAPLTVRLLLNVLEAA